jgi:NADH dehydrogenase
MDSRPIHAVTGAFGYSGRYIAARLLTEGRRVITLTNSVGRDNPFGAQVAAYPFSFEQPERLVESLRGAEVLYNTYWVRFNHASFTHADAVQNTLTLFEAARQAGVRRIIHISITNPSEDSPLEYFRGKARLERALRESGLSYAILRPTVLFGKEDILINNIAWALRHLPVFGVFGNGQYRVQPIYVDDLAALAVAQGRQADAPNTIINAIGPETFTYEAMVREIARCIGVRRAVLRVPPELGFLAGQVLGALVNDVMITREEIEGLMAGLLYVDASPTGTTRLSTWLSQHAASLGWRYASELARRRDRNTAYRSN